MKHLSLTITAILLSFISFAQTPVPGGNVSGTWTLAGSPYLVQGSVMIPDGSTLTIEPGVTVQLVPDTGCGTWDVRRKTWDVGRKTWGVGRKNLL